MWTINGINIGKINETWNDTMEQASQSLSNSNVSLDKKYLKSLSKAELEQLCRVLYLGVWWTCNKSELIAMLVEYYA